MTYKEWPSMQQKEQLRGQLEKNALFLCSRLSTYVKGVGEDKWLVLALNHGRKHLGR
jgi:hypothetical protein